jgi:gag-polypeptide of LTR copia-type
VKECTVLLATITATLITYVDGYDDPAKIWKTLKDKYSASITVTRITTLKGYLRIRMGEHDEMETHIVN